MVTFLTLPGEIRNQIYDELLFPHHTHIHIQAKSCRDLYRTVFKCHFYRTCSTIRAELQARLCATKTLTFNSYKSYKTFLRYMDRVGSASIVQSDLKSIAIQVQHVTMVDAGEAAYYIRGLTRSNVKAPFCEVGGVNRLELITPLDPDYPFVILERQDDGTFTKQDGDMEYPSKARFAVSKEKEWF